MDKVVPDTSVLIEGTLSKQIEKKEISIGKILIHNASLSELEHQANEGKTIGHVGLEEIKKLRALLEIEFVGERPRASEIKYARLGEIDNMIRQVAFEEGAVLMTSDNVQASVAEAKGIEVIFVRPIFEKKKLKFEKFFDKTTMSVHMRENLGVNAKKGKPGDWKFVSVSKGKMKREAIREMALEILESAKTRRDGFIEIERSGSTIVQLGDYRIVITQPAFSDGWEITAVRPVAKLDLKDYKLSEKLMERLSEQADGMLIAGAPGHGKTTFGRALAEFYASKDKIVKTVEAPRDMLLSDNITQYSISRGSSEEVHDVLLLSRPDHTIYDEMRNTSDFMLFSDLRLAGIGMIGVVHGTDPIDAVQRFLSRVELGVLPHIVDTVVFIKNGTVGKVLELSMTVKVPTGMTESDLARPVVEVNDFETGKLEYEIYTYGEQTVVIPVEKEGKKPVMKFAEEGIRRRLRDFVPSDFNVEMISDNRIRLFVPESVIPRIIGSGGKNIEKIEQSLGIGIDVESMKRKNTGKEVAFDVDVRKNITFFFDRMYVGHDIEVYSGDELILVAKVSKKGQIKVGKQSSVGHEVLKAIDSGRIRLLVK
ncbi:PINc/VapC family ATPase [Candidatus Woesearchaeota archaeon]|nr:PINc/VapC family ATPase [Candidatus Woesearchaeota archaeon]